MRSFRQRLDLACRLVSRPEAGQCQATNFIEKWCSSGIYQGDNQVTFIVANAGKESVHSKKTSPMHWPNSPTGRRAFTLMELLVSIAIMLVLSAMALPTYQAVKSRGDQTSALNIMRQLGGALTLFVGQNDGGFPAEDSQGIDTWEAAARAENRNVWYNALPRLLGYRSVAEFGATPREYYSKRNLLFLPGAKYPETDGKLIQPLFAIAINTKLSRRDVATGVKEPARFTSVASPSRTIAFLEQGLPKEKRAMVQQPRYDGSCKGSAKSFVTRYGGVGTVTFVDGHAETLAGEHILTDKGQLPFPPTNVVWTKSPDEDPNKLF